MKKKTNDDFVKELNQKLPNIKPLDNYINAVTKIRFKCSICGEEFLSKPNTILSSTYGCPKCSMREGHNKQKLKGKENFLKAIEHKFKILDEYQDMKTYVTLQCLKCKHIWKVRPYNICSGYGCPNCKKEHVANVLRTPKEEFIKKAKEIHPTYDYSKVEYKNRKTKVCIICPKHGEFWQTPADHIDKKCGCQKCKQSHGETLVSSILDDMNIQYERQYQIKSDTLFRKTNVAYIDFYIKLNNQEYYIEYNGELHYISKEHFGGNIKLQEQQQRDQSLRDYCSSHNIKLLEIPYYLKDDEVRETIKHFLE